MAVSFVAVVSGGGAALVVVFFRRHIAGLYTQNSELTELTADLLLVLVI